jgi:Golgi phosphoprotein 3 (GPP34)
VTSVQPIDGVAVRIAALCLGPLGRLSDRLVCGAAVRGGLLLDLALAGRVEQTDDSIVVDPTPIGFHPADRLLAAISVEPERSLDGWLDERRIGPRDVADGAVQAGRWSERRGVLGLGRRYVDGAIERTLADLRRDPTGDAGGWRPKDVCVAVVAGAAGLLDRESGYVQAPSAEVVAAAGSAAWLCTAIVEHLQVLTARWAAEAAGLGPF